MHPLLKGLNDLPKVSSPSLNWADE
jgi:hypothetical protein